MIRPKLFFGFQFLLMRSRAVGKLGIDQQQNGSVRKTLVPVHLSSLLKFLKAFIG
jgi:hypothetical protein